MDRHLLAQEVSTTLDDRGCRRAERLPGDACDPVTSCSSGNRSSCRMPRSSSGAALRTRARISPASMTKRSRQDPLPGTSTTVVPVGPLALNDHADALVAVEGQRCALELMQSRSPVSVIGFGVRGNQHRFD